MAFFCRDLIQYEHSFDSRHQLIPLVRTRANAGHSLLKEVSYYKAEVKENEAKLEEMKGDSDKDAYDVKRFEQVLGESYMMVPDSTKRLQRALCDLSTFMSGDDVLVNTTGEWYQTAEQLLRENNYPLDKRQAVDDGVVVAETSVDDLADGESF